ncbi:PilX N-terminal domain-containing pilus assembly protein [Rhodoferax sp.]|uniref:pilus assembly PilX family protein n=1 Tax=Rhodoferax sp. TaxID=50421 RepID=UPI00374DF3E0
MKYQPLVSFRRADARVRSKQRGFSLITTLILLIVVTVLGIGASQMVLLSERATRFDRDAQIAFQAAEAALIDAEFDIRGPNASASQRLASFSATSGLGFIDGCGTGTSLGLCLPAADGQKPVWYSVDFTDESTNAKTVKFGDFTGRTISTGTSGIRPEMPPRYIIEVLPDKTPGRSASTPKKLFRVTAMGFGPRKETQAVLQMIFRKE